MIDVSIIVPCFKSQNCIREQIKSWDSTDDGLNKEIIYVDDGCPFNSSKSITNTWENINCPKNIITHKTNLGFAHACNTGASHAQGEYLLFLNADTILSANWIRPLYDAFADQTIGLVGNMQLRKDGTIDSCGSQWNWRTLSFLHIGRDIYKTNGLESPFTLANIPKDLLQKHEVEMVTGACIMIPKKLFNVIGGFDTKYKIGYWEDAELNMQVRSHGYKIYFVPDSKIIHTGEHTNSSKHPFVKQNRQLFHERWVYTGILNNRPKTPNFFYFKNSNIKRICSSAPEKCKNC
jgi:GT2 family glycosyltransferase